MKITSLNYSSIKKKQLGIWACTGILRLLLLFDKFTQYYPKMRRLFSTWHKQMNSEQHSFTQHTKYNLHIQLLKRAKKSRSTKR